jgi:hypothetical protein
VTDNVKVEKVTPPNNLPLPATFEDITSETVNEILTPGGTAALTTTVSKSRNSAQNTL